MRVVEAQQVAHVSPPPQRDRLAGRYFSQCPNCRTHRVCGPDCGGSGPVTAKARRQAEKQAVRRYVSAIGGDDD